MLNGRSRQINAQIVQLSEGAGRYLPQFVDSAQRMSEVLKHMEYEAKHKVKLKLLYLLKNENIVSLTH